MAKLVFSYSHADEALQKGLETHLAGLKRSGVIETWHDRRIVAGEEFANQIDKNFDEADIILLLVSPDFIASDFCYNVEMTRAVERHNSGSVVVIPVILRPCDWHDLPFGKLLAGTLDGKPIVKFQTFDDGFLEVVHAIKRALSALATSSNAVVKKDQPAQKKIIDNATDVAIRSSNLRIKHTFTDHERDTARLAGYEYIERYFFNSLDELERRNPSIRSSARKIDANSFEATIYVDGNRKCHAGIWTKGDRNNSGIFFSQSGVTKNNYNENLNVVDNGFLMGFSTFGMAFHGLQLSNREQKNNFLSEEGAAEYLWQIFIQLLQ